MGFRGSEVQILSSRPEIGRDYQRLAIEGLSAFLFWREVFTISLPQGRSLRRFTESLGNGLFKIYKKIQFEENLCYLLFKKTIGLQKMNYFVYPFRVAGSKTIFQQQRPRLPHNLS